MRTVRFLSLAVLALALLAVPARAYVVILKDGTQIITRDQFRVEAGKARFTLQNGTESFLDMSEIDVVKTVEANKVNYGSAVVLDGGKAEQLKQATPTPRPPELADLIAARGDGGLRTLPTSRRAEDQREVRTQQTSAGYQDLMRFPRTPMRDTDVAATLLAFYKAQNVEGAVVYQGTRPKSPLIEIAAGSEASVFRGLLVSANALLVARDKHRDAIESLQVVMATPQGGRAGQFDLTPDDAAALASRRIELTRFYVERVQF